MKSYILGKPLYAFFSMLVSGGIGGIVGQMTGGDFVQIGGLAVTFFTAALTLYVQSRGKRSEVALGLNTEVIGRVDKATIRIIEENEKMGKRIDVLEHEVKELSKTNLEYELGVMKLIHQIAMIDAEVKPAWTPEEVSSLIVIEE